MELTPVSSWWIDPRLQGDRLAFYTEASRQFDRMSAARVSWPGETRPRDDGFRPGRFNSFSPWGLPHTNY